MQILADAYGHALVSPRARANARADDRATTTCISVVQAGRIAAAHAGPRARRARDRKAFGLGVHALLGQLDRDRSGRVSRRASRARARCASTTPPARWQRTRSSTRPRVCARSPASIWPTSICTSTSIGGGNIDGPSAGLAIFLALYSALTKKPLPQNIAVTGEISIQGKRARRSAASSRNSTPRAKRGCARIMIPKENAREHRRDACRLDVIPVATVEALRELGMDQARPHGARAVRPAATCARRPERR